jgi:hypothetical protein
MSTATIHIPKEHLGAVRESLRARRQEIEGDSHAGGMPENLEEIDAVLEQIDGEADGAPRPVTGPHPVLWSAAYDALCLTAERFAADCNELWADGLDTDVLRAGLTALGEQVGLLEMLDAPSDRGDRDPGP